MAFGSPVSDEYTFPVLTTEVDVPVDVTITNPSGESFILESAYRFAFPRSRLLVLGENRRLSPATSARLGPVDAGCLDDGDGGGIHRRSHPDEADLPAELIATPKTDQRAYFRHPLEPSEDRQRSQRVIAHDTDRMVFIT